MPQLTAAAAAVRKALDIAEKADPAQAKALFTKIVAVAEQTLQHGPPNLAQVVANHREIVADAQAIGIEPADLLELVELLIAAAH